MLEPADFRAQVLEFDRKVEAQVWSGPGYRMTFRALGEGQPLVILPGLASTYRGYAPTLLRLAERFRTITIDYPGENPNDGANLKQISHDNLVDDVIGLIDHLKFPTAILFGLSFGSTISQKALFRDPQRFPKAVLQGAFARRRLMPPERLALALGRRIKGTTIRLPFHELGLARNNKPTFPSHSPDRWKFYVEENGLTSIAGLSHRLDLLDRLDLRSILPEIHQPVRVIQGTADKIVPMKFHKELVAGLPDGESILMEKVGHQPHWTHPEELARLVLEFLEPVRS
jgi:pimeloyl-ACP methyl ester carboxylesterase